MDAMELWGSARALLLESATDSATDPKSVFLNLLTPIGPFGDQFILLAENADVESFVRNNYLGEIEAAVREAGGAGLNVDIANKNADEQPQDPQPQTFTAPKSTFEAPARTAPAAEETPAGAAGMPEWMDMYVQPAETPSPHPAGKTGAKGQDVQSQPETSVEEKALFEKCSFDTFVTGSSNELARGAAVAVAEQPGTAYNPLFIYGDSGLGKTHLLVAIAKYTNQNYPMLRTRYVSASKFMEDYVQGAERSDFGEFHGKYSHVDVLLVDDIQTLEGKKETINQLFEIFKKMTDSDKQVVLSADRAPKDIDMEDRMRSRFVSGLLVDIQPPDYETRLAILRSYFKRTQERIPFVGTIPDDVFAYLAEESTSNIREMEGAVNRLATLVTLGNKTTVTVDEAKECLKDFFTDTSGKQTDVRSIQAEVEHFFGISHEDMISSKRSQDITYPRHIAIYLCRFMTEESLQSIGKKFGGRDHTTVMHSVSKIEKAKLSDRELFDQLETLRGRIRAHS